MCKFCTFLAVTGQRIPVKHTQKILDKWGRAYFVNIWTLGDGLVLSNFWTKQARPYLSKNVSFLKEGAKRRHLRGA